MEKKDKERTSGILKYILAMCVACLALVLILLLSGAFSDSKKKSHVTPTPKPSEQPVKETSDTIVGIVKEIDQERGVITIQDVGTGAEQIFTFDGTTSFTSRYDTPITISAIPCGEIVEVAFDTTTARLKTCDITQKAWEYKEVGRWKMNKTDSTILIGSKTYQYTNALFAFDSKGMIDTNSLSTKDQVTIKGIGGQAYSIIVTKGHGFVSLTGCEAFLNGTIEVGYDIITTVTENMILTLREGDYKVTITKDGLSATKYISVLTGDNANLDFSEYKPEEVETGKCYFDVTPAGADLYINDVQTDYAKPIELKYGEYNIKVECAGYQTYYAKLTVANPKEVLTITLVDENQVAATPTPNPSATNSATDTPTRTPSPTSSASPSPTASATTTPTTSSTPKVDSANKIHIYAPIGAAVYLNGEYKGTIPVSFDKVIGESMKLTLSMAGHDSKDYTVTVKDDKFDVVWSFEQWWQ